MKKEKLMKTKKAIALLSVFLAVCGMGLFSGCEELTKEQEQYSEGLAYELNEDGKSYTVIGMGTCTDTEVILPKLYEELPVRGIGALAFSPYYEDETGLLVPDEGSAANNLTEVRLSSSVKNIGDHAFYHCGSLTDVEIPEGVTEIGNYVFSGCSFLTDIVIPDSLTKIGDHVFDGCGRLESVEIGSGVTSLGAWTFYRCKKLTNLVIPDNITSIEWYTFYECNSLKSVTIGQGVTSIGYYAFRECTGLESVHYRGTMKDWCEIFFGNTWANPLYYAHNLYIDDELVTEAAVPDGITKVWSYAFYECNPLKSAVIPDSVTSIGELAFANCSNLTSIVIPSSITLIDFYAFDECNSLTDVYYTGTEEEWNAIEHIKYSHIPDTATIHYNYSAD